MSTCYSSCTAIALTTTSICWTTSSAVWRRSKLSFVAFLYFPIRRASIHSTSTGTIGFLLGHVGVLAIPLVIRSRPIERPVRQPTQLSMLTQVIHDQRPSLYSQSSRPQLNIIPPDEETPTVSSSKISQTLIPTNAFAPGTMPPPLNIDELPRSLAPLGGKRGSSVSSQHLPPILPRLRTAEQLVPAPVETEPDTSQPRRRISLVKHNKVAPTSPSSSQPSAFPAQPL